MIFEPVMFLYLNPQLIVQSNITSIEQALVFKKNNENASFLSNLEMIPPSFDEFVFISDHKSIIDVSQLNQFIKTSMVMCDGVTLEEAEQHGCYYSTIYRNAYIKDVNTFQFNLPGDTSNFSLSCCNLSQGDRVKLVKNKSEIHYGVVESIIDEHTFVLSNDLYAFTDNAEYLVDGIKLYDPLRLARINYLKLYQQTGTVSSNYVNIDPEFNYELYKLLYKNARLMSKETAYIDYVSRRNNEEFRIARSRDIPLSSCNVSSFAHEYLKVAHHLHLDFNQASGRFQWGDINLYYVTQDHVRNASIIPPYRDGLITERAIKTYIDRKFETVADFSNVVIRGYASFCNSVSLHGFVTSIRNGVSEVFNSQRSYCSNGYFENLSASNMFVNVSSNHQLFANNINTETITANTFTARTYTALSNVSTYLISDSAHIDIVNANVINSIKQNVFSFHVSNLNFDFIQGDIGLFNSNVVFREGFTVEKDIECFGTMYTGSLCIADMLVLEPEYPTSSNIIADNLHVHDSLAVGNFMVIGDQLTTSNIVLKVNGIVEALNYDVTSDVNLKENIAEIHANNEQLNKVHPSTFNYKHKYAKNKRYGFIAQNVEEVFPEVVSTTYNYKIDIKAFAERRSNNAYFMADHNFCKGDKLVISSGILCFVVEIIDKCLFTLDHEFSTDVIFIDSIIYDAVKSIDYQQLTAILFKHVQDLSLRIETLENKMVKYNLNSTTKT